MEHEDWPPPEGSWPSPTVSITRVELRLYRRSRTSADALPRDPHFVYRVRVDWGTSQRKPENPGNCLDAWWASLPRRFVIQRTWSQIVKFHSVLAGELAFDTELQRLRVKAKIPELPDPDDLDTWVQAVAATGDACSLFRGHAPGCVPPLAENRSREPLDDLHYLYVENRLKPYFADINRVLAEVPPDVLLGSNVLRLFLSSGRKEDLARPDPLELQDTMLGSQRRVLPEEPERERHRKAQLAARPRKEGQTLQKSQSEPALPAPEPTRKAAPSRTFTTLQGREERLAAGHYAFFAHEVKAEGFSQANKRSLWKLMSAKESREMGRRSMHVPIPGEEGSWKSRQITRLPRLKPPCLSCSRGVPCGVCEPEIEAPVEKRKSIKAKECLAGLRVPQVPPRSNENIIRDICEGFRITILGEPLHIDPVSCVRREFSMDELGGRREVMRVYKTFQMWLEMDEGHLMVDSEESPRPENLLPLERVKELGPVSWSTMFKWVENKADFATNFRVRSAINTLLRALKHWLKSLASVALEGVTLGLLFRWIWPAVRFDEVADMLSWICLHELEKLQQISPPLISAQERKQLLSLFEVMAGGKDHCVPEDIAGGKSKDMDTKLKNIVDAHTVRAVCGAQAKIHFPDFLELMCQDGFRAHEGSTRVLLEDGSTLILVEKKQLGFYGWMFEDPPREELPQRRRVAALENEVNRWRDMSVARRDARAFLGASR